MGAERRSWGRERRRETSASFPRGAWAGWEEAVRSHSRGRAAGAGGGREEGGDWWAGGAPCAGAGTAARSERLGRGQPGAAGYKMSAGGATEAAGR